ncbi:MAG: zinc ABC transporter substrate-binding protein [Candidatus Paceibacterota bacterium]|jgi:zinc transport system substrate-binding protein|nr:zinc ABC transporter substrate-binding protein [Candidatus Paceibacterota bacterium]
MSTKKIIILVLGIAAMAIFLYMYAVKIPRDNASKGNLHVTASFYPLAFLAQEIGGDKVSVTNLTPAGAEPHDFEPSARDMAEIERSRVVIVNGLGLEPWIDNVKKNIDPKKTVLLIAGEGRDISRKGDPHIWLNGGIMYAMAKQIALTFAEMDAANGAEYFNNLAEFGDKINVLGAEYRSGLAECDTKSFVTSHDAFGYLAENYGLKQVPIAGLSPDAEPSSKDLGTIAAFAKENNIKYIFFESLVSPKLADTIANEIGAKTLVLNPLEGLTNEDLSNGKDYWSVMRENLANLKIALSCK